ncbi:hypothetical protein EV207_12551 [Scopulibacillus darangshiensis]|uniref:Uncharacterized protein n=1 Tax=Scopulibacillus darangshiensis TaxID=442528 RepID=A0A4R2NRL0_9BACL|nr:hypothetical protein [Scopulibacillus darangshiensis]TCP24490.1 hypothetical protein EV207_12551 [Scopulibacillus darangshiensis]
MILQLTRKSGAMVFINTHQISSFEHHEIPYNISATQVTMTTEVLIVNEAPEQIKKMLINR